MNKYQHRVMKKLRDAARDQACVKCGKQDGTVVLAHYFGPRRGEYGGGMSIKGHDAVGAWLCYQCHVWMDSESKNKEFRWEHSEYFLHLCALTMIQLIEQEILK
jgi:hypothetical protein